MRAAVRASPRSTAFVALAHALCDEGFREEAEAVCLQGLLHHPDLPTAQVALARAWLESGKTAQAEMRLMETIHQHRHHADAYRYLAKVMAVTERRAEAVAMLTRTRSDIVWTQELATLLESLAEGLPFEDGGEEAEITRVTPPRSLDRERRVGGERRQGDRRQTPVESASSENTVRMAVQFGDDDMREYAAAAPTPPPRPKTPLAPPTRTPPAPPTRTPPRPLPRVESQATPSERAHTPTGSFPPIATEELEPVAPPPSWPRILMVAIPTLLVVAVAVWSFRGGRLPGTIRGTGGAVASDVSALSTPPANPGTSPAQVAADIEADLAAGSLQSLLHARDLASHHLAGVASDDSARVSLGFVAGLLAMNYGIAIDRNEAQRLTAEKPAAAGWSARLGAQAAAARALLLLAEGDHLAAAEAVRAAAAAASDDKRVLLATAATRHRGGDLAAATAAVARAPRLGETWGAARPTVAALQIDYGQPGAALAALQPALQAGSDDALTLLLAEEARRAQQPRSGRAAGDADAAPDRLAAVCARDQGRSPTVRAACLLNQAIERRLAGDRPAALATARRAVAVHSTNPRVLGALAQLLANLGEIDEAATVAEAGAHLASPAFPPLAWANVAIAIGRGGTPAAPAGIQPAGPESRLVAARAQAPTGAPPAAGERDPDLRWLSSLSLASSSNRRQVIRFVESLERRTDRTPVTAYVAGTLALQQGRRHLAARWLAEALTGHGDTCRAAQQYELVLHRLKQTDRLDEIRAALAGHNSRCALSPP